MSSHRKLPCAFTVAAACGGLAVSLCAAAPPAPVRLGDSVAESMAVPPVSTSIGGASHIAPPTLAAGALAPHRSTFFGGYLVPRLSARLNGFRDRLPTTAWDRSNRNLADEAALADAVQKSSIRAFRSAANHYLLDQTIFERLSVSFGSGSRMATATSAGAPGGTRVRLGFAGIVPRAEVTCPTTSGTVRVFVEAVGDVTLEYQAPRAERLWLSFTGEPRYDAYGLSLVSRF